MNKGILGKSVVAACAAFVILGSLDAGLAEASTPEASTPDVSAASAEVGVMAGGIKMLCVQDDQWGSACP